jgi:hypothetical protein
MQKWAFRSKYSTSCLILFFIQFLYADLIPQQETSFQRFMAEGKAQYEQGEYKDAVSNFFKAKDIARATKEVSEALFYLSLAYFATGDNASCEEYLKRLFDVDLTRVIEEAYVPSGYSEIYHRLQGSARELVAKKKTEEEKPLVRTKPGKAEQIKKKKKGFPFLVVGIVLGGGVAAAALLSKKGGGGGSSTPVSTVGTIQVNSNPTGAKVFLDGADTGKTTNCTLTDISPGSHTVKLTKEGYVDYEKGGVSVTAGQTATVDASLTKHTITVTSPAAGTTWTKGSTVDIKWQVGTGLTNQPKMPVAGQDGWAVLAEQRLIAQQMKTCRLSSGSGETRRGDRSAAGKSGSSEGRGKSSDSADRALPVVERESTPLLDTVQGMTHLPFSPGHASTSFMKSQTRGQISGVTPQDISKVKIELYKAGSSVSVITAETTNNGSYTWQIASSLTNGSDYKVRVSCSAETSVYGESGNFTIGTASITVTQPASGVAWQKGQSYDIKWTSSASGNVKIDLYKGTSIVQTIASDTSNDGTESWTVPTSLSDGTDYKIRVSLVSNNNIYGESSSFAIGSGTTSLTPPTLSQPADGATGVSVSPTLQWTDTNSSPQETGYRVRIKPTGGSYAIYTVSQNSTSYALSGLSTTSTYSWSVQAVGDGVTTTNSEWANGGVDWSFTTGGSGPTTLNPPILTQPANGATGVSQNPTFGWTDTNSSPQETGGRLRIKPSGGSYIIYTLSQNSIGCTISGLSANTTYYWNVQAVGDGVSTTDSAWANGEVDWSFTTGGSGTPLNPPTLTQPANGATGISVPPTLQWTDPNSSPQETSYKIRIMESGWTGYAYNTVSQNTTSVAQGGLKTNTTYYWNVQAVGDGVTTTDSAWANGGVDWSFTTGGSGPTTLNPPTLSQPANGATGVALQATLQWTDTNSSPQETGYKVRIMPSGGSYTTATLPQNSTGGIVSGLSANTTYYWNVQAVGDGVTTTDSPWANGGVDWSFTTGGSVPTTLNPPTLSQPANGATGVALPPTVQWTDTNSSPEETGYKLRLKPSGGSYNIWTLSQNSIGAVISGLNASTTYYWNVQAVGDGVTTTDSAWANGEVDWSFTTGSSGSTSLNPRVSVSPILPRTDTNSSSHKTGNGIVIKAYGQAVLPQ